MTWEASYLMGSCKRTDQKGTPAIEKVKGCVAEYTSDKYPFGLFFFIKYAYTVGDILRIPKALNYEDSCRTFVWRGIRTSTEGV